MSLPYFFDDNLSPNGFLAQRWLAEFLSVRLMMSLPYFIDDNFFFLVGLWHKMAGSIIFSDHQLCIIIVFMGHHQFHFHCLLSRKGRWEGNESVDRDQRETCYLVCMYFLDCIVDLSGFTACFCFSACCSFATLPHLLLSCFQNLHLRSIFSAAKSLHPSSLPPKKKKKKERKKEEEINGKQKWFFFKVKNHSILLRL